MSQEQVIDEEIEDVNENFITKPKKSINLPVVIGIGVGLILVAVAITVTVILVRKNQNSTLRSSSNTSGYSSSIPSTAAPDPFNGKTFEIKNTFQMNTSTGSPYIKLTENSILANAGYTNFRFIRIGFKDNVTPYYKIQQVENNFFMIDGIGATYDDNGWFVETDGAFYRLKRNQTGTPYLGWIAAENYYDVTTYPSPTSDVTKIQFQINSV